MGDNVYATSLNRTATIFPFLLFSRVCVCVSRLSPSVPSLPHSWQRKLCLPAAVEVCWGLGGGISPLGETKKKFKQLAVPRILWGKNFLQIRHIFRKNKIEIATFA